MSLYLLVAALAIALLTNRWMARGSGAAFNIVSFDSWCFTAQWIAFALTLGALVLLGAEWRESGRIPPLVFLGGALLVFFVATRIPQTTSAHEWKSGDAGAARWLRLFAERGAADEVAPQLLGVWKSPVRSYVIERDRLTVQSAEGTEVLSAAHCPDGIEITFAYATDATFHSNPAAYAYDEWLNGAPVPSLEVGCSRRLYTFVRSADGTLVAFRDLHEANPLIEALTR